MYNLYDKSNQQYAILTNHQPKNDYFTSIRINFPLVSICL